MFWHKLEKAARAGTRAVVCLACVCLALLALPAGLCLLWGCLRRRRDALKRNPKR